MFKKFSNHREWIFIIFVMLVVSNVAFALRNSPEQFVWNVRTAGNEHFIGRKQYITQIKQYLSNGPVPLAILGIPGIGKTQLVKKYIECYGTEYDCILWFDAKGNLSEQWLKAIEELNAMLPSKDRFENKGIAARVAVSQLFLYLKDSKKKYLIVFDNARSFADIEMFLPNFQEKKSHIIITTSNSVGWPKSIFLSSLKRNESIILLTKILDHSAAELDALAELLNDYPLALIQAAYYLKSLPTLKMSEYIKLYKHKHREIWKNERRFIGNYGDSLSGWDRDKESFDITLSFFIEDLSKKRPLTLQILSALSMLYNREIPFDLLKYVFCVKAGISELELNEAISSLLQYRILEASEGSNGPLFHIKELYQLLFLGDEAEAAKTSLLTSLAEYYKKELMKDRNNILHYMERNPFAYVHVEQLTECGEKLKFEHAVLTELRMFLVHYLMDAQRYKSISPGTIESINSYIRMHPKAVDPKIFVPYHINNAFLTFSFELDNPEAMKKTIENITSLFELIKEPEYSQERCLIYLVLSQISLLQGDPSSAFTYLTLAQKDINQAESYLRGTFDYFMAVALAENGDNTNALKYAESSLENMKDHANLAEQMHSRILFYKIFLSQTDTLNLSASLKEQYELCHKRLSKENKSIVADMRTLYARSLVFIGQNSTAEKLTRQSLEDYQDFYGGEQKRPQQAEAYLVLGESLESSGRHVEAHEAFNMARRIYEKISITTCFASLKTIYKKLADNARLMRDDFVFDNYMTLIKSCSERNLEE
ncbi:MAG: hypothetical protein J0G29_05130 [Alphaproteobacteria bacterium]|nr:hypothetical protein [Alphaproteobacteria bacterium]OJV44975.1 MAG: hypothetical protein BGO28_05405 [Alphaproteobacteria bacterium 43-37]